MEGRVSLDESHRAVDAHGQQWCDDDECVALGAIVGLEKRREAEGYEPETFADECLSRTSKEAD